MKHDLLKKIIYLAFLFFSRSFQSIIYAQSYSSLVFKQYAIPEGIPSKTSSALYKDSYGFLWISNHYGISIFNGKEFADLSLYALQKDFYMGDIPHNFLQIDSNRLLISCTSGLFVFYYQTRQVEQLRIKLDKLPDDVTEIIGFTSAKDRIIVKTGSTIYFLNRSMVITASLSCINQSKKVYVKNEQTNSHYFYYTKNAQLVSINTETGVIDSLLYLPGGFARINVNGQLAGKYLITTPFDVMVINARTKRIIQTASLPFAQKNKTFIPAVAKLDKKGNFWIGGTTNLFIFNPNTNTISTIGGNTENDPTAKKLNTYNIADIWIDDESIFVSAFDGGIFEYRNIQTFKNYNLPKPFINHFVFSTLAIKNYVLGSDEDHGIFRFVLHNKTQRYSYFPVAEEYGPILQLENLDSNYIWAVFLKDFKLGIISLKNFTLQKNRLSADSITGKFFSSINAVALWRDYRPVIVKVDTNLFYFSVKKSLYSITGNVKQGFQFTFIDSISSAAAISCLSCASAASCLLGTTQGEVFKLQQGRLIKKIPSVNNLFIPIKSINTDSGGNLYLLTINGIYVYNAGFALVKKLIKPSTGLLNNKIYSGKIDKQGLLWMATVGGIMVYSTITEQLVNYPSDVEISNTQFTTRSIAADDSYIYFGGDAGITAVNTWQVIMDSIKTRLYFDEIRNGEKVLQHSLIPRSIHESQNFPYTNNSFSFSFKTIAYQQADGVFYKYMLAGFDTAWHVMDKDKRIRFLSLTPGKYTFFVQEIYPNNHRGAQITYSFIIQKPFWKTTAFIVLATLIPACLVVFTIIFFSRKKMEDQRIKNSLQLALSDERNRIAQELHDDLGSGLTSIKLLCSTVLRKIETGKSVPMLEDISKISGGLIDQMSEIIWVLNNTDNTLNGLLSHARLYMADYVVRTRHPLSIVIENNDTNNYYLTNTAKRNLLLIIKETFHNAINHSEATTFSIHCAEAADSIRLTITDNGKGLPEQISYAGNGLNNIKKRVKGIKGTIRFDTNSGTSILITFPAKNLHYHN